MAITELQRTGSYPTCSPDPVSYCPQTIKQNCSRQGSISTAGKLSEPASYRKDNFLLHSSLHTSEYHPNLDQRQPLCRKRHYACMYVPVPGCCLLPESLEGRRHPRLCRAGGGFRECVPRRFRPPTACAFTVVGNTKNKRQSVPMSGTSGMHTNVKPRDCGRVSSVRE